LVDGWTGAMWVGVGIAVATALFVFFRGPERGTRSI